MNTLNEEGDLNLNELSTQQQQHDNQKVEEKEEQNLNNETVVDDFEHFEEHEEQQLLQTQHLQKDSLQLPLIKRLKHKFKVDQEGEDELIESEVVNGLVGLTNQNDDSNIQAIQQQQQQQPQAKKARTAATPGKPRGATYDGNACMICSDRASGFHYGVLACEGCKGFFKRICKEPNDMQSKRHCVYGGNCEINLRTRNRCQYCRIQKCLQLGMSKDGIKLGRRSRKFKENLVQIVNTTGSTTTSTTNIQSNNNNHNNSCSSNSTQSLETNTNNNQTTQNNELQIKNENNLQKDAHLIINTSNSIITLNSDNQMQTIVIPAEQSHMLTNANNIGKQVIAIIQDNKLIFKAIDIPTSSSNDSPSTSPSKLIQINPNIITNGNTLIEVQPKIEQIQQTTPQQEEQQPEIQQDKTSNGTYTVLELSQLNQINEAILQAHNETWLFSKDKCKKFKNVFVLRPNVVLENQFSQGLMYVLRETKFLDFFNSLIESTVLFAKNVPYFMEMHEQDRITLLKSCVFEIIVIRHSNFYDKQTQKFILPHYESFLSKDFLILKLPDCKLLIEILFDFYNEFCMFDLNDSELAIFSSYLLFNADNDVQFNDSDKITNYKDLFRSLLIHEISKRPHKLAVQQIQQWIHTCAIKLKKLNQAHSDILAKYKKNIQFPDLYSELYNL